jgi:hypothetical protein
MEAAMGSIAGKSVTYRSRAPVPGIVFGEPGMPSASRLAGMATAQAGTPPAPGGAIGAQRVLATVLPGVTSVPGEPLDPVFRQVDYAFAGGRCVIGARIDFVRDSRAPNHASAAWCAACAPAIAAAQLETGAVAPASVGADIALLLGAAGMRVVSEYLKWRTGGGSARGAQPHPATHDLAPARAPGQAARPLRGEALLARERMGVDLLAAALLGARARHVEPADLTKALASAHAPRRYLGAFLAGRCHVQDAEAERQLARCLEQAATWSPQPDVAIEAAMSLVLRGKVARGREALDALLASPRYLGDQYKAAFYLAQLGDPSGYGALLATLRGPLAHYRLMAMRHLIAFQPYDGQLVGGRRIDVEAVLAERLTDPEPLVRAEAMPCLIELRAAAY